jgi:hypothetical protein
MPYARSHESARGNGSLSHCSTSPTIDKLEQLASVLGVHPLSLLAMAYVADHDGDRQELCAQVVADLQAMTGR